MTTGDAPDTSGERPPSGSDAAAAYAQLDAIEVPFLRDVAVALVVTGHDIELDVGLATIDVDASDPWVGRVLGVVRPLARGVGFYAVHPQPVPPERFVEMSELVVRATDAELDVALELALGAGTVAARTSVTLGDVEVSAVALGGLLSGALAAAESALLRYRSAIEAVAAGSLSAAEAAAQARRTDLDALAAEFAALQGTEQVNPRGSEPTPG